MGSVNENRGNIIVVGSGYAGLSASIELRRKGFEVLVVESVKELTTQGKEGTNCHNILLICICFSL